MRLTRRRAVSCLLLSAALHAGPRLAVAQNTPAAKPPAAKPAATGAFDVGQAVEVREGDAWSKAKILAREGRRFQIEYDDGTKEWVTSERLRAADGTTPPAAPKPTATVDAPAAPADDDAAPAAAKKPTVYPIGTKIEAKWGGLWSAGTVKNRRGEWYLIAYDRGSRLEWVEPWRLRTPGSSYDIGHASPNPSMSADRIGAPPRDKPGPAPAADGDDNAAAGSELETVEANVSGAAEIVPAITAWAYKPAGPAAPGTPRPGDAPIGLQAGSGSFFESLAALDVNGGVALVCQRTTFEGSNSTADVVNLGTGASVAHSTLDPSSIATSVTADGRRVAARSDGKTKTRVDVYDVAGKPEAQHVVSFAPYAASGGKDVEHAIFVDETHLITVNREPHLICWQVGPKSARAVWQLKATGNNPEIAVSPDRKSIALLSDGLLLLVDATTGRVQGSIETSVRTLRSPSFRGDGKRLVALDGPTLVVFDLEAGQQAASLGLPVPLQATNVVRHLAGDNVWLAGADPAAGAVVLDLAARALVGRYKVENVQQSAVVGDRLVVATKDDKRRAVMSWAIPGPAAKPATPLPTVRADAQTRAALDVQVDADEPTRQAITEAMRQQIAANGWQLAAGGGEGASVRVVVRTENGKTEQQTYQSGPRFGPFARPGETVSVTEKISRVTVEVNGKPAWQAQTSSKAGFMLSVKEGQTMQQAADEASRFNFPFLKSTTLPRTLFVPMETLPAAPTYTLVPGGIRPG